MFYWTGITLQPWLISHIKTLFFKVFIFISRVYWCYISLIKQPGQISTATGEFFEHSQK